MLNIRSVSALIAGLAASACAAPQGQPVSLADIEPPALVEPEPIYQSPEEVCASAPAPMKKPAENAPLEPLLRTPPIYPLQALNIEQEGYCYATFDVMTSGLVDPETILMQCDAEIFVEPATRAVERWCFAPRIGDEPARRLRVGSGISFQIV